MLKKWMVASASLAALADSSVLAAEIKVLTAGAFKPVVTALVPEFEKQTGHRVTVENHTAGALTQRISGGEAFDLVVLTPALLAELTKAGKVAEGSTKLLARRHRGRGKKGSCCA